MGEGVEGLFAAVGTGATVADTAESEGLDRAVEEGVVYGGPSGSDIV